MTAYDKDGVRMLLNFASDCPPGRPDVLVMVVSMLNTAPLPVHNVVLQAAVPKVELFICSPHLPHQPFPQTFNEHAFLFPYLS